MMSLGKIAVYFACGLGWNASTYANDVEAPTNSPYSPIVARNVFGLNPPSPSESGQSLSAPASKIKPNGIMSIFGQLQVLFKVTDASGPGQPPKDTFYTLGEGEQQDGIEVTHIDENASLVTFNNHGIMQEIALSDTPEDSAPESNVWIMSRANRGSQAFHPPGSGGSLPAPANYSAPQPTPNTITPEMQTLLMAAQHNSIQ